jgi:transposase-like protein
MVPGQLHSAEQIIRKLRQADEKLASGASVPEVARELEISKATYHRWRNQYGGMNLSETKRLKELEKENARLKKIVADQVLDIQILKEVSRKKTSKPDPEKSCRRERMAKLGGL